MAAGKPTSKPQQKIKYTQTKHDVSNGPRQSTWMRDDSPDVDEDPKLRKNRGDRNSARKRKVRGAPAVSPDTREFWWKVSLMLGCGTGRTDGGHRHLQGRAQLAAEGAGGGGAACRAGKSTLRDVQHEPGG